MSETNVSPEYNEGYRAYQAEKSPEDNPYNYHRNYDAFSDWEDGWYTAELDANDDFDPLDKFDDNFFDNLDKEADQNNPT